MSRGTVSVGPVVKVAYVKDVYSIPLNEILIKWFKVISAVTRQWFVKNCAYIHRRLQIFTVNEADRKGSV